MERIYFISGVCGVGKSTIIPYLKKLLPQDKFIVYDFDERGVPENADHNWRMSESKHWMDEGASLAQKSISTVVCGFIKPTDLSELIVSDYPKVVLVLLDAKPEIIRERLMNRYSRDGAFDETQKVIGKPVNEFIESNVYFVEKMRDIFKEKNCRIIDTSDLTPDNVARKVVNIILNK